MELAPGYKKTRFGDLVYAEPVRDANGERCLVLAIIDQARRDFLFTRKVGPTVKKAEKKRIKREQRWNQTDSAEFFLGDDYGVWMHLLGLPDSNLPDGITTARLKYQIARYPLIEGANETE